jgi:hypothetical protein
MHFFCQFLGLLLQGDVEFQWQDCCAGNGIAKVFTIKQKQYGTSKKW